MPTLPSTIMPPMGAAVERNLEYEMVPMPTLPKTPKVLAVLLVPMPTLVPSKENLVASPANAEALLYCTAACPPLADAVAGIVLGAIQVPNPTLLVTIT